MNAVETRAVTIEEYLTNPAFEHSEYIGGEVVERNVGTGQHGRIQLKCGSRLMDYLEKNPLGAAYVELHCKIRVGGEVRYRLPDVCVVLGTPEEGYLDRAPELCVEIRSPSDHVSDQLAKFEDYFANGCKLGWLVLPEENCVLILEPASIPKVARVGGVLDGGNLLPGLQIPVAELLG